MGDLFFSGLISELQIRKSDSLTSSFDIIKKKIDNCGPVLAILKLIIGSIGNFLIFLMANRCFYEQKLIKISSNI